MVAGSNAPVGVHAGALLKARQGDGGGVAPDGCGRRQCERGCEYQEGEETHGAVDVVLVVDEW